MSIDRTSLERLLGDLVRIDSRNPWLIPGAPGEGAVAATIVERVRSMGLEVGVEEVASGRPNVIARLPGASGGPSLCLNAHIDTVGDASWAERSRLPEIHGDRLIGLGAADDKGHVAAVLLALEELVRSGTRLRGDLVAAFTMDEEATSEGTLDLVRRHPTEAAIVVEPFGIGRAIVTHQGFGWLDIVVHGRAAHGSAPDVGIDAISHAADVIHALDRLGAAWKATPHPLNGATVYHASVIAGGSDYATYPASVTLGIEIGTQPGETIADRVSDIEGALASIGAERPDLRAEVVVQLDRDPFLAVGHETLLGVVADATRAIVGTELTLAGENAWMDCAIMQSAGIPTISVGASGGNLHAPDEWVSLPELVQVADTLLLTARGFCGEA